MTLPHNEHTRAERRKGEAHAETASLDGKSVSLDLFQLYCQIKTSNCFISQLRRKQGPARLAHAFAVAYFRRMGALMDSGATIVGVMDCVRRQRGKKRKEQGAQVREWPFFELLLRLLGSSGVKLLTASGEGEVCEL